MRLVAKIDIDNEAAREFNQRVAETGRDLTFFEFLEEKIKAAVEQIDELGYVEIMAGEGIQ